MSTTTKTLQLGFKSANNKPRTLIITDPAEGLQEDAVRNAMQKLIDAHAFAKDNQQLYTDIDHANYITREVETIVKA